MVKRLVLDQILKLDPQIDHARIVHLDSCYEFPFDFTRADEFALYRTYAVPSIANLLDSTGEVGEEPVSNHFGESNWSQIPYATQKSFDYWAELGESGIAPGGDLTPSNPLDGEKWRKEVLAGEKIPPPQATVLNSDHRLHATPGSEERRWEAASYH